LQDGAEAVLQPCGGKDRDDDDGDDDYDDYDA
jgi:hypothetical protein